MTLSDAGTTLLGITDSFREATRYRTDSIMLSEEDEEYGAGPLGYSQHERIARGHDDADGESELEHDTTHENNIIKTAYYNAASEKSLSHEEAKLFYQRHQLEQSKQDPEAHSPLSRARTFTSVVDNDGGLARTTSTASRRSTRSYVPRDRNRRLPTSGPDANLQSAGLRGADFHSVEIDVDSSTDHADGEESYQQEPCIGGDIGNASMQGSDISPELSAICVNIRRVLDIRHKYINLSLQGPGDNPKDGPDWKIHPPPPNPIWDDNKNRPVSQRSDGNSLSNSRLLLESNDQATNLLPSDSIPPVSPTAKQRKPGHDIGEDFDMSDFLPLPDNDEDISFTLDRGSIYQIFSTSKIDNTKPPIVKVPTLRDFYKDMDEIQVISSDGPTKSFAYRQLDIIEGRFLLYFLMNSYQETADSKKAPHRDFYNVRKVDTHVHHSACMNQKHLLRFIKSKMKKSPDEIVMFRDSKELTLHQVFESINLTAYDLSIDTLDMHVCRS